MTHVVVRFEALGPVETRVTLVVDGWGDGPDWDESFRFFDNAWREVMEQFRAYLDGSKGADRLEKESEPQHTTQGGQGE
jgi:hypothetical protein